MVRLGQILSLFAFLMFGSQVYSSEQCALLLYGAGQVCSSSGGCTIDWLSHVQGAKTIVHINDHTEVPETVEHTIFSRTGFDLAVRSFDPTGIIGKLLDKLVNQATSDGKLYVQYVAIGDKDDLISLKSSGIANAEVLSEINREWTAITNESEFQRMYTMVVLIAEKANGHPIRYDQRRLLMNVYQSVLKSRELAPGTRNANLVWGVKATQDVTSKERVILLYDPGKPRG